jgi:hypothetical protein
MLMKYPPPDRKKIVWISRRFLKSLMWDTFSSWICRGYCNCGASKIADFLLLTFIDKVDVLVYYASLASVSYMLGDQFFFNLLWIPCQLHLLNTASVLSTQALDIGATLATYNAKCKCHLVQVLCSGKIIQVLLGNHFVRQKPNCNFTNMWVW